MEKIVVGIDGSRTAQQALAWAAAEARLRGAGLVVIHTWQQPATALMSPYAAAQDSSLLVVGSRGRGGCRVVARVGQPAGRSRGLRPSRHHPAGGDSDGWTRQPMGGLTDGFPGRGCRVRWRPLEWPPRASGGCLPKRWPS